MYKLHQGRSNTCKLGILVDQKGNGIIITSVYFEDDSLPEGINSTKLLPLYLRENQITEVPWRRYKRGLFGSTIREFKDITLPGILSSNPVEELEIPLTRADTLLIGPGLPQDGELFNKVFFLDLEHETKPSYNFDSRKKKPFKTCRGTLDLYDIMINQNIGLGIRRFDPTTMFKGPHPCLS